MIYRECLVLLKSGYVDGAHARWRDLHELAVISFFFVRKRGSYFEKILDHAHMRKVKESKDYQEYCQRTGQQKYSEEEIEDFKQLHTNLVKKYGDEYGIQDYAWIPKSILKNRN